MGNAETRSSSGEIKVERTNSNPNLTNSPNNLRKSIHNNNLLKKSSETNKSDDKFSKYLNEDERKKLEKIRCVVVLLC